MKISVISVHKVKNFGSALLCYATQEIFRRVGFDEVEFLNIKRGRMEEADNLKEFLDALTDDTKNNLGMGKPGKIVFFCVKAPSVLKRAQVFNQFLERYLKYSALYKNEEELGLDPPKADVYCTGGDQMWNEMYNGHKTYRPVYLEFAPSGKPKVSFSTSFGKKGLEPWEVPEVSKLLRQYSYITVREKSGTDILEKMGIANAANILDPTLVLDGEFWRQFSRKEEKYKGCVVAYRVARGSQTLKLAKKIAGYMHKKLVLISYGLEDKCKGAHSIFVPPPERFVGLIDAAGCVVTDSFHATAFSINLNKKFVAVLPPKTSTRIENIVKLCGLEERVWREKADIGDYVKDIDYGYANKMLEYERGRAMKAASAIFRIAEDYAKKDV